MHCTTVKKKWKLY